MKISHCLVGAIALLISAAACNDPITPFADVSVAVNIGAGNAATRTIRNLATEPIYHHAVCSYELELREAGNWSARNDLPYGDPILCTLMLVPPRRIGPGESVTQKWDDLEDWIPGEYRFRLALYDEAGNPLPDNVRTSNAFLVE